MWRNLLSLAESSGESSFQLMVQCCLYVNQAWLLTWLAKHSKFSLTQETSLQASDLWISFVTSILSLSKAQHKIRHTFNDVASTLFCKVLYLFSSLMNTLASSLVCIGLVTAAFDAYTVTSMYGLFDGRPISNIALALILLLLVPGLSWVPAFMLKSGLAASHTYPNITTTRSSKYNNAVVRQLFWLAGVSILTGIINIYNFLVYYYSVGHSLSQLEKKISRAGTVY